MKQKIENKWNLYKKLITLIVNTRGRQCGLVRSGPYSSAESSAPSILQSLGSNPKYNFYAFSIYIAQIVCLVMNFKRYKFYKYYRPIKSHGRKYFSKDIEYFKNGPNPASFCFFMSFSRYNFNNTNWKSIDGVLGMQTRGRRMVGADITTELWLPPFCWIFVQ